MVTINDSSLSANVFETIYDFLKTKATADGYNSSSQPTITAAYIDKDDEAYPQIVVNSPERDADTFTLRQNMPDLEIRVMIDIYSFNNKEKDVLADDVVYFIQNNIFQGLYLVGISESFDMQEFNKNKVKLKTLTFTFRRK